MAELKIKIRAPDPKVVEDLFGELQPPPQHSVRIDADAEVIHQHSVVRQGFVETGVIVQFLLKVAAGVATKVAADWLSNKLQGKKVQLEIDGETVSATDQKSINAALKKALSATDDSG